MKEWATVYKHKGYNVQVLNNAGSGDCMEYKVEPSLPGQTLYSTIGDAIQAIDEIS